MNPDEFQKPEEAPAKDKIDPLLQQHTHSDIPDISILPVTKQYLKEVRQLVPGGNRFYFSDGISDVEIKVVSAEIIRVRMAPQGQFLDEFSYALANTTFQVPKIEVKETTEDYIVSTQVVLCRIRKNNFCISFSDAKDNIINEDAQPMHWEENPEYGGYYVFLFKKMQ